MFKYNNLLYSTNIEMSNKAAVTSSVPKKKNLQNYIFHIFV